MNCSICGAPTDDLNTEAALCPKHRSTMVNIEFDANFLDPDAGEEYPDYMSTLINSEVIITVKMDDAARELAAWASKALDSAREVFGDGLCFITVENTPLNLTATYADEDHPDYEPLLDDQDMEWRSTDKFLNNKPFWVDLRWHKIQIFAGANRDVFIAIEGKADVMEQYTNSEGVKKDRVIDIHMFTTPLLRLT
jgi:hypothetical protein